MLQISHSELKIWRICHRQWYLSYYLEYAPRSSDNPVGNAQLGTRIHAALEGAYGYGLDALEVLDYQYKQAVIERPEFEPELEKERGYALAMVEGYLDWSAEEGIDAGYTVLATEHEVQHEITLDSGEPVIFRGKLDQLIRREIDGALLLRDWKTVGTLTKANMLAVDTQMRFYAMLQAFTYPDQRTDGALYVMLLRSKHTERAKGPFYDQIEVHYNRHDLNSMFLHAKAIAQEIVSARQRLDHQGDHREITYASPGDHCRWQCPFLNVCPLMDDNSRWRDALNAQFQRCDPYARYSGDTILSIRKALGGN